VSADVDTSEENDESHACQRVTVMQLDCRFGPARIFVCAGRRAFLPSPSAQRSANLNLISPYSFATTTFFKRHELVQGQGTETRMRLQMVVI
jgi:hypothetical protein